MSENEVTKIGFGALANKEELSSLIGEELNGLNLTFDRIKIPSGGSTAFEVPGDDGEETEMVREITGVILYHHPAYAYYPEKYAGGSNPPECGSFDGITGIGVPGGACDTCPYNRFGSGDGQSKACKNRRMIYILREGEIFPMVLSLPTGSLKEFTKYVKRQLTKGRKPSGIVTKISLKKASSTSGIAFSQAVFSYVRNLTVEERAAVAPIAEEARNYASHLTVDSMVTEPDELPVVDALTGEVVEPLS